MKKGIKESDVFVGSYFTQLRIEHRYTQEDLCKMLNLNQSSYCAYERGTRGLPFKVMKKLCTLYHLNFYGTIEYLDKELEKKGLTLYE